MARIGIFGAGWVGLVTGTCLADLGHEVVVRDIVAEKIAALSRAEVPFHEEGLPALLERNAHRLRLGSFPFILSSRQWSCARPESLRLTRAREARDESVPGSEPRTIVPDHSDG